MPIFEIAGPDGQAFQIEGPNQEGAIAAFNDWRAGQEIRQSGREQKEARQAELDEMGFLGRAHQEGVSRVKETAQRAVEDFNPYSETNKPATSFGEVLKQQLGLPGKALSATLGLATAYPRAAAGSVVGREVMAPAIRYTGQFLNPEVAAKQTNEDVYQTIKEDVEGALDVSKAAGAVRGGSQLARRLASEHFDRFNAVGNRIPLPQTEFGRLADDIRVDLFNAPNNLRRTNVPRVWDEIDRLEDAGNLRFPDLSELAASRQRISAFAYGKANDQERLAANIALNYIDGRVRSTLQRFGQSADDYDAANFNWAKFHQAQRVEEGIQTARERAGSTQVFGSNFQNALKQEMRKIRQEPMGLTPGEMEASGRAASGGLTSNILGWLGRLDPTSGAIPLIGHAAATAKTGGMNWVLGGGAFFARKMAERLALKDAKRLQELIMSRNPEMRRLSGPMQEWQTAAEGFAQSSTPANLSRLVIASRNLSHNLKDFDISVSANELMRALQGPSATRAEEEDN